VTSTRRNLLRGGFLCLLAVCAGGCDPSGLYTGDQRGFAPGTITAKSRWRVTGGLENVQAAADGDPSTAASGGGSAGNATLTIDLGEACLFNMVVIDHGSSGGLGYPRRLALLASTDGQNFRRLAVVPGTRRVTLVNIITPYLARYIRLQAVARGPDPLSIAEVHIQ
jgi:hypothetical protein